MKLERDTINQIILVAANGTVPCNLLPHVVEHQTCLYELSSTLVELLDAAKIDFRARHQFLNLQATLHQHKDKEENFAHKHQEKTALTTKLTSK